MTTALRERGVELGHRQVCRYLKGLGASYKRTVNTLEHKQDRAKVERAQAELEAYKRGSRPANSS